MISLAFHNIAYFKGSIIASTIIPNIHLKENTNPSKISITAKRDYMPHLFQINIDFSVYPRVILGLAISISSPSVVYSKTLASLSCPMTELAVLYRPISLKPLAEWNNPIDSLRLKNSPG